MEGLKAYLLQVMENTCEFVWLFCLPGVFCLFFFNERIDAKLKILKLLSVIKRVKTLEDNHSGM